MGLVSSAQRSGCHQFSFGEDDRAPHRVGDGCNIHLVALPDQLVDHPLSYDRGGEKKAASHRQGEHSRRPTKRSGHGGDHLGERSAGGD